MTNASINILYIADIVGQAGLEATRNCLAELKAHKRIDCIVANGENLAQGKGMTHKLSKSLMDLGIDIITSGNHIWDKDAFHEALDSNKNILRPMNYPPGCPGHGFFITEGDIPIGVINLQGRSFMYPIDCPFRTADVAIGEMLKNNVRIVLIDFHAESTAEKMALGYYLDGRISVLIGSHTHVQTADERILPQGTSFITDAGMTGSYDSVIGMEKQNAIKRFLTQMPVRYQCANGDPRFSGVFIEVSTGTGRTLNIERVQMAPKSLFNEISDGLDH
jgi:2',3'-cyclic-nucleotide 2'-phosphodiesterase